MRDFSHELKEKTICHFKEKYDITISPEKATEYLHAFADLFMAFHVDETRAPRTRHERAEGEARARDTPKGNH